MVEPGQEQGREGVQSTRGMLGKPIFEVAPQAFDGIEFGGIGGKEEQRDVGRQAERVSFVKGPVIEEHEMEAGGVSGREVIEEELKALRIEEGQFQKETLAGERFHRAIQVQTLKAIGSGDDGLHSPRRDAMAEDGQQPTTAFILDPDATATVSLLLSGLDGAQELRGECSLELGHRGSVFFGWERRGALGLACN